MFMLCIVRTVAFGAVECMTVCSVPSELDFETVGLYLQLVDMYKYSLRLRRSQRRHSERQRSAAFHPDVVRCLPKTFPLHYSECYQADVFFIGIGQWQFVHYTDLESIVSGTGAHRAVPSTGDKAQILVSY
jgi:hypothetical protein